MTDSDPAPSIDWARQAKADLAKLAKRDSERIKRAIKRLADSGYGDLQRLRGFDPPQHRLRVGDWRVTLRLEAGTIRVIRVLHRREAYRKSSRIHQDAPASEGLHEYKTLENPGDLSDEERASL